MIPTHALEWQTDLIQGMTMDHQSQRGDLSLLHGTIDQSSGPEGFCGHMCI